MKKTILTLTALAAAAVAHAQGSFVFQNFAMGTPDATVTIGAGGANGEGAIGAFVGSTYTASLFFENGTVSAGAFDGANPTLISAANSPFFGTTGGGPTVDGAGDFSYNGGAGIFNLSQASGATATVQARVWYNAGGATSYAQALALGQNVGESNPVTVTLATGQSQPPTMDGMNAFTVQAVPEPGIFALAGLAAAGLMGIRRKK